MKKIVTIVLVSLLSINASLAQDAVQPGYSTANLVNPQHSMPDLLLESSQLNNFLNENGTGLSTRFKREQRVKLYSLINSAVINKFQNQTLIKPVEQDTVLTNLFSWADGLGVYGGSAIYNNLKDNASAAQSPITKVPSQYQISLINDLLMVSSPDYNWQVTFPYYYMLTAMYDTINQGGNDTQIVSISTGM
ncbi:MAG: hypothetical protein P8I94_09985, partial [Emcibacteraceae bacterium]|nr:hypothetical protein [Emcibacteraceae bacterium]